MRYLLAAEYGVYGLGVETPDDLVVAASAMVDAFCRRTSLGVTQYVERLRFGRGCTVRVSNLPLMAAASAATALVGVRVRLHRVDCALPLVGLMQVAQVFGLGGMWSAVDVSTIDVGVNGELGFTPNLLGVPYDEAEVTYTAGYADVPVAVKVACAQIVRSAQATPALTVKRQVVDRMQMEYFSATLLDADVQRMLQPYVSQRMG